MINIVYKELEIEEELKKRIKITCDFCNTKPTFLNGIIRNIERTNLSYIESHRIIIKEKTFLAFNYSNTLYVGNLSESIELKNLKDYIKELINYINFLKKTKIWLKKAYILTNSLLDFTFKFGF